MVEQLREISRDLKRQGYDAGASEIQKTAENLSEQGLIPEDLKVGRYDHSNFSYDSRSRTLVFPNGERKRLRSNTSHETLIKFLQRPNEVIGFDEIDPIRPQNAKKRVSHLRVEIRDNTNYPKFIISVHGGGYLLYDESKDSQPNRPIQPNEEIVILDAFQEKPPLDDNQDYQSLLESLSFTERRLFNELIRNRGNIVEKARLEGALGRKGKPASNENLRFYIRSLRKKSISGQNSPFKIVSIRGAGYMLE